MKIKFCGLFRECDIEFANALMPDLWALCLRKIQGDL